MFILFDVRRSSFKTTRYGIKATCEYLQNNLAFMGQGAVQCVTVLDG
jgi:hypothetical protein